LLHATDTRCRRRAWWQFLAGRLGRRPKLVTEPARYPDLLPPALAGRGTWPRPIRVQTARNGGQTAPDRTVRRPPTCQRSSGSPGVRSLPVRFAVGRSVWWRVPRLRWPKHQPEQRDPDHRPEDTDLHAVGRDPGALSVPRHARARVPEWVWCSSVAKHRRVAARPFPHGGGAYNLGVGDLLRVVEFPSAEADWA